MEQRRGLVHDLHELFVRTAHDPSSPMQPWAERPLAALLALLCTDEDPHLDAGKRAELLRAVMAMRAYQRELFLDALASTASLRELVPHVRYLFGLTAEPDVLGNADAMESLLGRQETSIGVVEFVESTGAVVKTQVFVDRTNPDEAT